MEALPEENALMAVLWLALAVGIAGVGVYVLFTAGKYLVPSFLGLSLVLVYVGRQRLNKYKLEPVRFQNTVGNLTLFVALAAAIGGGISANV